MFLNAVATSRDKLKNNYISSGKNKKKNIKGEKI